MSILILNYLKKLLSLLMNLMHYILLGLWFIYLMKIFE